MRRFGWDRLALVGIAALAAVLYTWGLSANGYGNSYYAAAALAASKSWSAWFFGSLDAGNFITVDKPPLATMVTGLSVRIFGLSSWSVLLPQALMGVATVVVLFLAVRRSFGPAAALIAGLVMALSPVAVLMFRLNDPDALLTLLLVIAAALLLRGIDEGRIRWAVAAAAIVGLAFLTKYLQAYLVLPAFALAWAVEARTSLRARIAGLAAAAGTVLVSSAWWVVVVDLTPSAMRPHIGGSANDSALDLLLGYDGLQRIVGMFGRDGGLANGPAGADGAILGAPAPGSPGGFGGSPGILRLFNTEFIGQIAWLLPLALFAFAIGLALHARSRQGDRARAAYLLWGAWLVVTAAVFSFMSGIVHHYYTVMLTPAIAALIGGAVVDLRRLRDRTLLGGIGLAVGFVGSAAVAWGILDLTPSFAPGLGAGVVVAAIAASALLLARPRRRRMHLAAVGLGVAALLAGPAAYALETATTPKTGAIPSAGPVVAGAIPAGPGGAPPRLPPGAFPGQASGAFIPPPGAFGRPPPDGYPPGAPGGPRNAAPGSAFTPPAELTRFLVAQKGTATWVIAVRGAQEAGSLQLATGAPVMAMGGFSGSDPVPTLDELKRYVASGRLRYVLVVGPGGPGTTFAVETWVAQSGTVVNVGASYGTLYDLAGK